MILPSGSLDPPPFKLPKLVGRVIVILLPALATGGTLAILLTTIVTLSSSIAPWLSVTLNWNTYVPTAVRPLTCVVDPAGVVITGVTDPGPVTKLHAYVAIVPSGSKDPVPSRPAIAVGWLMVTLLPALATGGWLEGTEAFTITMISSVAVAPLLSVTVSLNV